MAAEAMASRLCSHGHATCSLRLAAQPLPTIVRANRIDSRQQSHPGTARYCNTAVSNSYYTASSNANAGFRRSHQYTCSSTSAETDATVSGLQADLEAAVSAEDYQRAAKLRDELM